MKRLFTLPFFLFLFFTSAFAQLSLQNGTSDYLIDFNSTVTGVNSGSFTGSGFTSNPNSGQLDTDAWATTGLSDGAKNFGISNASGDHARGSNDGGVSTGGIYGFDIGGGNRALGIQPTGSDWTPGTITLKIVNNSSSVINDMDIDYNIFVRNDQNRASSFNFSYSFNNSSFTDATGANYTSPQSSGGTVWIANSRNVQLSNLSLNPGDDFYIRWSGSDAGGSGSRDEFALDDIAIMAAGSSSSCTQPTAQATNLNFGTITSNSIQATFSASSADKFLVVQSTNPSLGAAPTDGVIYTAGNPLGTGEVLQFSNSTSINALALASNTTYYYSIFAANDNCSGGPDYLSTNPLTGSAATTSGGSNYYDGIGSETCADLKTALYNLIDGHTSVSYNSLWTHYQTTDDHLNDAGTEVIVWDMYSDNPNGPENEFTFVAEQCGSYTGEGSCYNREHTFPKSWWGGSTSTPQYTDLFTVLPADGWINGVRNNNPYGEVQSGTESQITNNGSALGSSSITIPGYSGSVFEPIDEYKGDLARGYFYMATRYENVIAGWENNNTESDAVMNGTSYPVYEQWMIDMLISWHNSDPVDTKEIERNEAVFGIQGNRNPFIDHPEYVGLIWSNCGGGGDTEAPTNPTNLMASNTTETSTNLSWTISNDNIGVAGYYIYQDGINVLISNGTGTSADITGLNSSTTYNFYVTAFDAAGNESTASNSINVTTNTATDTEAPTTPSALAASNTTETSTDLNWNPSSDNIAVAGYNIYQDATLVATASNNSSTINGLTESTTYNFYVTAFDAAGNESTASNSINVTTNTATDTEAPTTPSALAASNTTETSTDLNWNPSSDNIAVVGYNIYQDAALIATASNNSSTINGLTESTTYNFYVTAFDAAGNESIASNSINVTTNTATDTEAPTNPTALTASNTSETSTDLNWNTSSDNIAVVGYNIYQDAALVATASNNSSTINGLTESTTYNFYVTAFDAAGNESTASNSINVTTATSNSGPTVLHEGYFESGWDGWQDGGSDCARYSGANSYEGSYSIRIRDNSGTSSAMTSPSFDLSNHNNVDITFSFMAKSMESNEDFWLRYFDGNSWQTVATYSRGNEFNNNTFYTMNVVLNSNDYNFPTNAQFRFQCDASANNDKIFVDAVIITADVSPSNLTRPGSNAITQVEAVSDNDVAAELEMELELELETEKVFENKSITIYPNPTSNFLNVNLQSFTPELSQMTIVNTMGQVVRNINNNLSDKIIQIDVSSLSKGIYFLRVVDNNDELQTLRFYVH